jgi:hypothetical protein
MRQPWSGTWYFFGEHVEISLNVGKWLLGVHIVRDWHATYFLGPFSCSLTEPEFRELRRTLRANGTLK